MTWILKALTWPDWFLAPIISTFLMIPSVLAYVNWAISISIKEVSRFLIKPDLWIRNNLLSVR